MVIMTSLLTRIKNLHWKRMASFIRTSTHAYPVWNWLSSFCSQTVVTKLNKPMMDPDDRPQHSEHARHNRFLPSLFSIISSTLSTNIGSCGVKAHGPDQTAIAHSCENVTKALLIASPLSIESFSLKSCSTRKPDIMPDNCGQPAH